LQHRSPHNEIRVVWATRLQSGKVFLKEHFVLAVLYVQLRACSGGVYGRAFLDFRKMFGTTEKGVALRPAGKIGRSLKQSLQHPGGRNPRPFDVAQGRLFENREDRGSLSSHDVGKEGKGWASPHRFQESG
jgi:hypothetical protein